MITGTHCAMIGPFNCYSDLLFVMAFTLRTLTVDSFMCCVIYLQCYFFIFRFVSVTLFCLFVNACSTSYTNNSARILC